MEPKVRFKGFEGEWQNHKLAEKEFDIIAGGDINRSLLHNTGKYPVIANALTDGGILGFYEKSYKVEGPAVTITGRGDVGVAIARHYSFTPVVRLLSLKSSHNVDFLANAINCCKVAQESTGVPQLTTAKLQEYSIAIPKNFKEEDSIGCFFTSLDSLSSVSNSYIASLKKLKSASLVAMFPQQGETTPKVRFKGFEGEWRRIKFGTISSRITRRNNTLECKLPLTISANEGLISQEKFFKNIVASSNLGNYYLLKRGEFAYNKSYSNGYPFGAIKRLDKYDSGVLSPLYICFGIHDEVDSNYICFFFETTLWHKDVAERATEGARNHGILNIGTEDFFDIDIMIPESKEEQQSIATFFRTLNRKIALETARLEKLKQIKLACLDKMFV